MFRLQIDKAMGNVTQLLRRQRICFPPILMAVIPVFKRPTACVLVLLYIPNSNEMSARRFPGFISFLSLLLVACVSPEKRSVNEQNNLITLLQLWHTGASQTKFRNAGGGGRMKQSVQGKRRTFSLFAKFKCLPETNGGPKSSPSPQPTFLPTWLVAKFKYIEWTLEILRAGQSHEQHLI